MPRVCIGLDILLLSGSKDIHLWVTIVFFLICVKSTLYCFVGALHCLVGTCLGYCSKALETVVCWAEERGFLQEIGCYFTLSRRSTFCPGSRNKEQSHPTPPKIFQTFFYCDWLLRAVSHKWDTQVLTVWAKEKKNQTKYCREGEKEGGSVSDNAGCVSV